MLTLIKLGKKAGHSTSAEQGKFRRAKTPPDGGGDYGEVGQVGEGWLLPQLRTPLTCAVKYVYLQARKRSFVDLNVYILRTPAPETYSFMLFWDSTTVEMIMVIRARAIQSQPRSVTWNFSPSTM